MAPKPKAHQNQKLTSNMILTTTLQIAESQGWVNVRMNHLAKHMDVSLSDLRRHYQDMNAIADDWFAYALDEMLTPQKKSFSARPPQERLFIVITRWLDSLAVHHRVSAQMINQKLYLFHPQHWVPSLFSLSTLVHWILDAAMINFHGRQRKLLEVGTSLLILVTLRVWVEDDSEKQTKTHTFLRHRLNQASRLTQLFSSERSFNEQKNYKAK